MGGDSEMHHFEIPEWNAYFFATWQDIATQSTILISKVGRTVSPKLEKPPGQWPALEIKRRPPRKTSAVHVLFKPHICIQQQSTLKIMRPSGSYWLPIRDLDHPWLNSFVSKYGTHDFQWYSGVPRPSFRYFSISTAPFSPISPFFEHLLGSPREFLQYSLEICHLAIVVFIIFVRGWGHKIHGKKSWNKTKKTCGTKKRWDLPRNIRKLISE